MVTSASETAARETAGVRACASAPVTLLAMLPPSPVSRRSRGFYLPGHQSLDQPGIDQQPVETAGLGPVGAAEESAVAADHDFLLLGEGRIERQACGLLKQQRQIDRLQPRE